MADALQMEVPLRNDAKKGSYFAVEGGFSHITRIGAFSTPIHPLVHPLNKQHNTLSGFVILESSLSRSLSFAALE